MWPDNETTKDLIGFKVHADLVRSIATNPLMLPTTIGIFGDWGGGKTSIMRMIEHDLDPDLWPEGSEERRLYEGIATVYVDTWLFEGYDDAKSALLSAILMELIEHKRFGEKVKNSVTSLLKSVNWLRFTRMAVQHVALPAAAAFFTGGIAALPAAVALSTGLSKMLHTPDAAVLGDEKTKNDEKKEDKPDWASILKSEPSSQQEMDIRTFRERFKKMLDEAGIRILVVLVDDLDRCTAERVIENLEAVKLFLSTRNTAFIIGADRRVVEHAIRTRYASKVTGNAEEMDRLVRDYLEKLVQIPYNIPSLSISEIETYLTLLFCQEYLEEGEFDQCLKACNDARTKTRYASFGLGAVRAALGSKGLNTNLASSLAFVAGESPLIAEGLKGNPRQVKRFLNALMLRKELAKIAGLDKVRDEVLVKLMILEYLNPDLFAQLYTWQAQHDGFPPQIAELEALAEKSNGDIPFEEAARSIDPKWAMTSARKWVILQPSLRDVDLRDYFWIARDRLGANFTGLSMVSPFVRQVLDGLLSSQPPKRNEALKVARAFGADDRGSLFSLLAQYIAREPGNAVGYQAIRFLVESEIPGAPDLLAKTLTEVPLDSVPPAVGVEFMTLYSGKREIRSVLEAARERLLASPSRVGKAAQSVDKR